MGSRADPMRRSAVGRETDRVMIRILKSSGIVLLTSLVVFSQTAPVVTTTGPVSTVHGSDPIKPALGTAGNGTQYNFLPYIVPGQFFNDQTNTIVNDPFDIAYTTPRQQPVQTSDWWTGIGLQWGGWVVGQTAAEGAVGHSTPFINEPFMMDFFDVINDQNTLGGMLPHGLRMWNQSDFALKTDGRVFAGDPYSATANYSGSGLISQPYSPVVTVGLQGVHPLGLQKRDKAPWSNVKVRGYSDWGVEIMYADAGSEMNITMANGSPFVWFERTQGAAPFVAWIGEGNSTASKTVWYNQDGVLGVTVSIAFNPYQGITPSPRATAAYVLYADGGTWIEQKASGPDVSAFTNPAASRVAVLALPHNVFLNDPAALTAALRDLQQYACLRIADTKIHYPPIAGSDSVVASGFQSVPLGYDEKSATLRMKLEATTTPFPIAGCEAAPGPLQMVFPHHRKVMDTASRQNILQSGGNPQYTWRSVIGELQAYRGTSYVRELPVKGVLPFLPGTALNLAMANPLDASQTAVDDIYETMKTWFYVEEPQPPDQNGTPQHLDSFLRNPGTYVNVQTNTYMPSIATLYESLVIADQLSQSAQLAGSGTDADLGKAKTAVATEMREQILQTLKEMLAQWASVHTAQFFVYNPEYNSAYGFPDGYGSVQNFNDHHFHFGYFLRAAAMVGRYDPAWLQAYMPLFDLLRRDVATYDRSDTQFPFLREFSPFYGHSWANGTSDAGGNDQESTSEAVNFAVGLIDLGQVLGDKNLRDLGLYMFEEEVLASEQYWFNQDADLTRSSGSTYYNGNWPDAFVHFQGPDGQSQLTTLVSNVKQFGLFRTTFFGGVQGVYTIQATPLSAHTLYLGRNQQWLKATWQQYLRDLSFEEEAGVYEVLASSLQARLPDLGSGINDTGLAAALTRIAKPHNFFPGATNTTGKYWAYTNSILGQVDSTVVADTPSYGVFVRNGQRTYVAYNPGSADLTVTFTDTATGGKTTMTVPALSMATQVAGQPLLIDALTPPIVDSRRLYLHGSGTLSSTAGTSMPPSGDAPFPRDNSALLSSLETIQPRPDNPGSIPLFPPASAYVKVFTGTFSGKLIGNTEPTRFSFYTDQALFPGWQQDPLTAANVISIRISYDFDDDGNADRVEILQNVPMLTGNTFLGRNKITEYFFDQVFGGANGRIPVFIGDAQGGGAAPFPDTVTNGTVAVEFYGGSGAQPMAPVPLSVDADPITGRASWIKPPYHASLGGPPVLKAVAGPKDLVTLKRRIVLDGAASISPDGRPLAYDWTSLDGRAEIAREKIATPLVHFNSGPGFYTFQLAVTDSQGHVDTDQVQVTYIGP